MAAEHAEHHDTFHHVRDFSYFELLQGKTLQLPEIPFLPSPSKILLFLQGKLPEGESIFGLQLTKFMVLQVIAALLVFWIGRGLAKRIGSGEPVTGRWWNFWETLAVFIRDEVVRPTIGTGHHGHGHGDAHHEDPHLHVPHKHDDVPMGQEHSLVVGVLHQGQHLEDRAEHELAHPETVIAAHRADQYLPFVWTCFFFVLICNLLGAFPFMGSATGEINVTAALALCAVAYVISAGTRESGVVGFWVSLAPKMDVPGIIKPFLVAIIWVIEFFGFLIKHAVLAIRLFANIMAGHTVIGVFLMFIAMTAHQGWLYYLVVPASTFGQLAIGMLELFVAFLQAYVFAFLASLFISGAVNPH